MIDKQRINLADVEYLNLESVAKVMLCRRLYKGTGKSSVQGEKGEVTDVAEVTDMKDKADVKAAEAKATSLFVCR